MFFDICIIGQDGEVNKWEQALSELGRITKFNSISEAHSSSVEFRFSLTFVTTNSFERKVSDEIFDLRKSSHSRVVVLGSLEGFSKNFLSESAVFDWCNYGLDPNSIKTRANWYKERIISPINHSSRELIHEINIQLTRKEEIILNCLYDQKVIYVEELHDLIWKNTNVTSHVLDVHLSNLRKKIKPFNKTIKRERNGKVYLNDFVANNS